MTEMMTMEMPAVSLLDVLLSVSTEMEAPDFTLDSAFQGQTCLVAVNETDLTATLFGLLDNTKRNARKHQHYSAYVNATGETMPGFNYNNYPGKKAQVTEAKTEVATGA